MQRYLRSFSAFSKRGLFSFDVDDNPSFDAEYHLITVPKNPLFSSNLPSEIFIYLNECMNLDLAIKHRDLEHLQNNIS